MKFGGYFDSASYQVVSDMKRIHGLDVVIENPKGSIRRGRDWEVIMPYDYGYVRRTVGADDDAVDVAIGPHRDSNKVFLIDQRNERGEFDEHKAYLGYRTWKAAHDAYIQSYHDHEERRIGGVTSMQVHEFRRWLDRGEFTTPASGSRFKGHDVMRKL